MLPDSFKGWGWVFPPSATQTLVDMGSNCFSLKLHFQAGLRLPLCVSPPFLFSSFSFFPPRSFLQNLGQLQDCLVSFGVAGGDGGCRGRRVICTRAALQPALVRRGCSASPLLRSLERKTSRDFIEN